MVDQLEKRLQAFDGKAVSILSEIRADLGHASEFLDELISLCSSTDQTVSSGATWILKAVLEDGTILEPRLVKQLVYSLDAISDWQAKLHILQLMDALALDDPQSQLAYTWAMSQADHPRPFLRAWSLHTRVAIAKQHTEFLENAQHALTLADSDEAASVRARARNLRKELSGQKLF